MTEFYRWFQKEIDENNTILQFKSLHSMMNMAQSVQARAPKSWKFLYMDDPETLRRQYGGEKMVIVVKGKIDKKVLRFLVPFLHVRGVSIWVVYDPSTQHILVGNKLVKVLTMRPFEYHRAFL